MGAVAAKSGGTVEANQIDSGGPAARKRDPPNRNTPRNESNQTSELANRRRNQDRDFERRTRGIGTRILASDPPIKSAQSPYGNQCTDSLASDRWERRRARKLSPAPANPTTISPCCLPAAAAVAALRAIDQFDWDRDVHRQAEDEDTTRSIRLFFSSL